MGVFMKIFYITKKFINYLKDIKPRDELYIFLLQINKNGLFWDIT